MHGCLTVCRVRSASLTRVTCNPCCLQLDAAILCWASTSRCVRPPEAVRDWHHREPRRARLSSSSSIPIETAVSHRSRRHPGGARRRQFIAISRARRPSASSDMGTSRQKGSTERAHVGGLLLAERKASVVRQPTRCRDAALSRHRISPGSATRGDSNTPVEGRAIEDTLVEESGFADRGADSRGVEDRGAEDRVTDSRGVEARVVDVGVADIRGVEGGSVEGESVEGESVEDRSFEDSNVETAVTRSTARPHAVAPAVGVAPFQTVDRQAAVRQAVDRQAVAGHAAAGHSTDGALVAPANTLRV